MSIKIFFSQNNLSEAREIFFEIACYVPNNYASVRILVLRFVIPYASTKVNSYAMKLYPTCGALFGVTYS